MVSGISRNLDNRLTHKPNLTKEMIVSIHKWIFNYYKILNSMISKNIIKVRDNLIIMKTKVPKLEEQSLGDHGELITMVLIIL